MSRRKKSAESLVPEGLYRDAYRLQWGQYYPERHEANVQRLQRDYPQLSVSEIDAIYRQACRIDSRIKELAGRAELTESALGEALKWLAEEFPGFPSEVFAEAIERAR